MQFVEFIRIQKKLYPFWKTIKLLEVCCEEIKHSREIEGDWTYLLPLLEKIKEEERKQEEKKKKEEHTVMIIAIDGNSASGKSTAAECLAEILDAGIIHMDDFFLPAKLRTLKRLSEPGGNVHYERFCQEVLPYLADKEPFFYHHFDCSTMQIEGQRKVNSSKWRIVEGAYSLHPKFGNYADLTVFFEIEPKEQLARILKRNGEEKTKQFISKWIPMEENYIKFCHIPEKADLILSVFLPAGGQK